MVMITSASLVVKTAAARGFHYKGTNCSSVRVLSLGGGWVMAMVV